MTDDLFDPLTPPTVNVTTKRCSHTFMAAAYENESPHYVCTRCGKVRDESVVRRNRGNRQRGASFERSVAKRLGGRRTGPLGGRDDVMVGGLFAAQTKRAQRFSLAEARQYLDDLRRTYPDRVPIVVHAFPGERGGVVVVGLDDWVSLHGEDATREEA